MQRAVKELVDAVGLGDAIEIVRRWGGREFTVPLRANPGDPLALTLGLESARKLVAALGGVRLALPVERNALLDLRNAQIFEGFTVHGRSMQSLGLEYGITRQAVAKVLRARGWQPEEQLVTGSPGVALPRQSAQH